MKLFFVDNASGGAAYDQRWKAVCAEFQNEPYVDNTYLISSKQAPETELAVFHSLGALTTKLMHHLKHDVDDDSIIIFANARDPLAIQLHQYRLVTKRKFKMFGFWSDGVYSIGGEVREKLRHGSGYRWSSYLEKTLAHGFDLNLLVTDRQLRYFVRDNGPVIGQKSVRCALPFSNTVKDIQEEMATYDIAKEDMVILNTPRGSLFNQQVFDFLVKDFPEYTCLNLHKTNMSSFNYRKELCRAKVVVSTSYSDANPYWIYESMSLGCIPLLPDIPIYKELFDEKWLYPAKVLTPPYLNFMRNLDLIHGRIRDSVENYLSYNLEEEVKKIHDVYFDSSQLKAHVQQSCNQQPVDGEVSSNPS